MTAYERFFGHPESMRRPERGSKVLGARWMADRNRAPCLGHAPGELCSNCDHDAIREAMRVAGESGPRGGSFCRTCADLWEALRMMRPGAKRLLEEHTAKHRRDLALGCRDCDAHPYGCCARHADLEAQEYEAAKMRLRSFTTDGYIPPRHCSSCSCPEREKERQARNEPPTVWRSEPGRPLPTVLL